MALQADDAMEGVAILPLLLAMTLQSGEDQHGRVE